MPSRKATLIQTSVQNGLRLSGIDLPRDPRGSRARACRPSRARTRPPARRPSVGRSAPSRRPASRKPSSVTASGAFGSPPAASTPSATTSASLPCSCAARDELRDRVEPRVVARARRHRHVQVRGSAVSSANPRKCGNQPAPGSTCTDAVSTSSRSQKIACAPFPWCASTSSTATRATPLSQQVLRRDRRVVQVARAAERGARHVVAGRAAAGVGGAALRRERDPPRSERRRPPREQPPRSLGRRPSSCRSTTRRCGAESASGTCGSTPPSSPGVGKM